MINRIWRNDGEQSYEPSAGDEQAIKFNFDNRVSGMACAEDILRFRDGGREAWEMRIRLALLRHPPARRNRLIRQILAIIYAAK